MMPASRAYLTTSDTGGRPRPPRARGGGVEAVAFWVAAAPAKVPLRLSPHGRRHWVSGCSRILLRLRETLEASEMDDDPALHSRGGCSDVCGLADVLSDRLRLHHTPP